MSVQQNMNMHEKRTSGLNRIRRIYKYKPSMQQSFFFLFTFSETHQGAVTSIDSQFERNPGVVSPFGAVCLGR